MHLEPPFIICIGARATVDDGSWGLLVFFGRCFFFWALLVVLGVVGFFWVLLVFLSAVGFWYLCIIVVSIHETQKKEKKHTNGPNKVSCVVWAHFHHHRLPLINS